MVKVDDQELRVTCNEICEKIDALPGDEKPEIAYKKLLKLKQMWSYTFINTENLPDRDEIKRRYEQIIEKAENRIKITECREGGEDDTSLDDRSLLIIKEIASLLTHHSLKKAILRFKNLQNDWETIVQSHHTIDDRVKKKYDSACHTFIEYMDWAMWANYKNLEKICNTLEELKDSDVREGYIERFEDLQLQWKQTGPIPEKMNNAIWKKYRNLCSSIHQNCHILYKKQEEEFETNLNMKEKLCHEIEALIESKNWKEATQFVLKIQKSWNSIGPVPKEEKDRIWERFHNACHSFFQHRKQYFLEIRKKQQANLLKKRELCKLVEKLKTSTDWKEASAGIQNLQKEWQSIGPVSKHKEKLLWEEFRSHCDYFFNSQKQYFDSLEKDRQKNLEKKEELCRIVESIENLSDQEKYETILNVQERWKKIGPVPRDKEEEIWKRFRTPVDRYFEKRKRQKEEENKQREINRCLKEELCLKAEELCKLSDWKIIIKEIKALQKKWKAIGPAKYTDENALWNRFHTTCDTFFQRLKSHEAEQKANTEENIRKKMDLCFQAEIISGVELTEKEKEELAEWQLNKLSANFWYNVLDGETENWENKAAKLKELQKEWKETGRVVPKNMSDILWKRFKRACDHFFAQRRSKK